MVGVILDFISQVRVSCAENDEDQNPGRGSGPWLSLPSQPALYLLLPTFEGTSERGHCLVKEVVRW